MDRLAKNFGLIILFCLVGLAGAYAINYNGFRDWLQPVINVYFPTIPNP